MEEEKVRIHWTMNFSDGAIGNAYGYRTHNNTLRRFVEKIAVLDPEAPNALTITSPEFYDKVHQKGKYNFLFSMFEGTTLPQIYLDAMDRADHLLVPSTWVKSLFCNYFNSEKISVIPHGVTQDFKYKKRKMPGPGKPFRFFWVGAPNPRKGWEEIINIWKHTGFNNHPRFELYFKTTLVGRIEKVGNVVIDGRDLPKADLIKLYNDAHCFVFPTRGEGFGLTLAEAMRTGLPCISTYYSGVTDFFDEKVGFPVGYKLGKGEVTLIGTKDTFETIIAFPDVVEIGQAMFKVVEDYREALRKGKVASERISRGFTWQKSAETLVEVIRRFGKC